MAVIKITKQQELENCTMKARGPVARKANSKMPGTRVGTLEDWREGGAKRTGERSQRGERLRDGR